MGSDMGGYLLARRNNTERNIQYATLGNSDLLLADASENPDTLAYVITEAERREQMSEGTKQTNTFFRPFGVFFGQDSTSKFAGFQAKAVGAQFGADQIFGDKWIVGVGGAYSHSCLDFDEGHGDADIDSFRLGPYVSYFVDRFYVDGSLSFGYHLNKTRRHVQFAGLDRTAEADYGAYDLSAYIGGGYELDFGRWTLTPTILAQYTCYRNESFKEDGAGAAGLDVDAQTQESLLSRVGIRLYRVLTVDSLKLAPEFFVGYAHEFMDEDDISARFVSGITKFSADVDSDRDDSVYFGAGLSTLINDNTSAFVRYEGESYSGSRSNALKVGLTIEF